MISIGHSNCRSDEESVEGCNFNANDKSYAKHPCCDVMNNSEIRISSQASLQRSRWWVHMDEAKRLSEMPKCFSILHLLTYLSV